MLTAGIFLFVNPTLGSEKQAVYTAKELQRKIAHAQSRLISYSVVYENDEYDSTFPPGTYVRRMVAAKAPYNFLHLSTHGHEKMDWKDDPFQQKAYVTEREVYNVNPVNQTFYRFETTPDSPLPGSLKLEFFILATGIWPLDRTAPRRNLNPWVLKEVAESEHYSVVRHNQELINGRWCHVLEWPNEDTLWLDVERSCALLARETRDPNHTDIIERYELSDLRRFPDQIWLPMKIRRIRTQVENVKQTLSSRDLSDTHIRVVQARVNDLPNKMFLFHPNPGALQRSANGGPAIQVRSGGFEHLDNMVQWAQRCGYVATHKKSYWREIAIAFLGFIVVIVFELCRIRRTKKDN